MGRLYRADSWEKYSCSGIQMEYTYRVLDLGLCSRPLTIEWDNWQGFGLSVIQYSMLTWLTLLRDVSGATSGSQYLTVLILCIATCSIKFITPPQCPIILYDNIVFWLHNLLLRFFPCLAFSGGAVVKRQKNGYECMCAFWERGRGVRLSRFF